MRRKVKFPKGIIPQGAFARPAPSWSLRALGGCFLGVAGSSAGRGSIERIPASTVGWSYGWVVTRPTVGARPVLTQPCRRAVVVERRLYALSRHPNSGTKRQI